jgi:ABC-type sulfate transport system permease component
MHSSFTSSSYFLSFLFLFFTLLPFLLHILPFLSVLTRQTLQRIWNDWKWEANNKPLHSFMASYLHSGIHLHL